MIILKFQFLQYSFEDFYMGTSKQVSLQYNAEDARAEDHNITKDFDEDVKDLLNNSSNHKLGILFII